MNPMNRRRWIGVILLLLAVPGAFAGCTSFLLIKAWIQDNPVPNELPAGYIDDASRLNRTQVSEVWPIPADGAAAEAQLQQLMQRAHARRLKVAIAGARHSMGGHTIFPDGIVIDMLPFKHMSLDADKQVLRIGAGARWSDVIPYLDARGFSVAIMQSNNDFSVGGSISVNCHGWQHDRPPIASTVKSLRLMKANGTVIRCSRQEEAELFSLVLGGYGLFGIILDLDLEVVSNERYRPEPEVLPSAQYVGRFVEKVRGAKDIGMVYGRLCVVPGEKAFLREAILMVFRQAPCGKDEIPRLASPGHGHDELFREMYRAQIGSQAGKEKRWLAEKSWSEQYSKKYVSRNQLLNEGASVFQEHNADRTDILHEYFIPPQRVAAFLDRARAIVPKHQPDLLNVTVRNVLEDKDTWLAYADQEMFSFVMLFNQPRSEAADADMEKLTQELIDAALECGGRYYLPYRLHATKEQFFKSYPKARGFFERKRFYDPGEIFQNQFYVKYGKL